MATLMRWVWYARVAYWQATDRDPAAALIERARARRGRHRTEG